MLLWILLFAFQTSFGAANDKKVNNKKVSVTGKLCIHYCQPCTTEQLGPYKEHCLKTFGIKHDSSYRKERLEENDTVNILAHEPLHKLWIAVKTFSHTSSDWALFGYKKINKGSQIIGEAFPHYAPLAFFLDPKLNEDDPLFFDLSLGNQKIKAKLSLDQAEYKHQWGHEDDNNEATFTTAKGMIIAILRRHWADCKMQMWRLPPKKTIGTVTIKNKNGKEKNVSKDEYILSKKFGYSPKELPSSYDDKSSGDNNQITHAPSDSLNKNIDSVSPPKPNRPWASTNISTKLEQSNSSSDSDDDEITRISPSSSCTNLAALALNGNEE